MQSHLMPTYIGLAVLLILANLYLSRLYRANRTCNLDRLACWGAGLTRFCGAGFGWLLLLAAGCGQRCGFVLRDAGDSLDFV